MDTVEIENRLKSNVLWPVEPTAWEIEAGTDNLGEPALWIWVTLADEIKGDVTMKFREMVRNEAQKLMGSDASWVYVRFRSAHDEVTDEPSY